MPRKTQRASMAYYEHFGNPDSNYYSYDNDNTIHSTSLKYILAVFAFGAIFLVSLSTFIPGIIMLIGNSSSTTGTWLLISSFVIAGLDAILLAMLFFLFSIYDRLKAKRELKEKLKKDIGLKTNLSQVQNKYEYFNDEQEIHDDPIDPSRLGVSTESSNTSHEFHHRHHHHHNIFNENNHNGDDDDNNHNEIANEDGIHVGTSGSSSVGVGSVGGGSGVGGGHQKSKRVISTTVDYKGPVLAGSYISSNDEKTKAYIQNKFM